LANTGDSFGNVIWSDNTIGNTMQTVLSQPKHPVKVHVWAGISKKGSMEMCIFEETMDASLFCEILRRTSLP